MNNQQQRGPLTTPGYIAPDGQIHNSLNSYVGSQLLAQNNSPYQPECSPMAQFSHQKQQAHTVNSYQGYRQAASENYSSNFGDMSAGNAVFQSMAGFGLENDQLGMQRLAEHHLHYLNQQYYQASQPRQDMHIPHHQQTTIQHHLQHFQQQQREQAYQISSLPQPDSINSQKQSLPVPQQVIQQQQQQLLHQQTVHQQQPVHQQPVKQQQPVHQQQPVSQPKHILQNPLHASKTDSSGSQKPIYELSPQTQQPVTTQTTDDIAKNNKVEDKQAKNGLHQETKSETSEKPSLASTKEKTPLCLINELAHFNKLHHQFVLEDEQGPAHKKTFRVKLKLADEEYIGVGESIKKAQNAVAAIALKETKYPHPQPKQSRFIIANNSLTTELRDLALKRGEAIVYKTIEPQQSSYYNQPGTDHRRQYTMRYHDYMHASRDPFHHSNGAYWPLRPQYLPSNRTFYVCISVGQREFVAEGLTRQEARHNAEQKTLGILKNLPVQDEVKKETELTPEEIEAADNLKSEISLVHEVALRRNMTVIFEVTHEAGLPHMKDFITKCAVGDLVTEGSGNSKKTSKKKAAELMLEELKKLPGVSLSNIPKARVKLPNNRKRNHKLVKSELQQQKTDPKYGADVNPISRLIQLTQAKKQKDPVYTLISEKGLPTREFVIQVSVEDKTCTGTGPNKKLAKRSAAEAMLQVLGCTKSEPQPIKSALKHTLSQEGNNPGGDKRVKFVESTINNTSSTHHHHQQPQQRVPGLLHLPSGSIKSSLSPGGSIASSRLKNHHYKEQLDDLCDSLNYELKISDLAGKQEKGTEQVTADKKQQNLSGGSSLRKFPRKMAGQAVEARASSVCISGDGPQVKSELTTTPASSTGTISK